MLKAVLFDLDGTMACTDPIHLKVWQDILAPYGIEVDESVYKDKFSGRLNENILGDLLPDLSPQESRQLSDQKEAQFRTVAADQLRPMPGLLDLLDWLQQQGMDYAVVTNAPRPNAEFMLQTLALDSRFEVVVIGDDLSRGKPDPLPYQTALAQLGCGADEAIAFEDSPAGLRSAIAAGLTTIGLTSTHAAAQLEDLGAALAVSDFTDPRLAQFGLSV